MISEPVRAGADWLALREPADAAARAGELVEELRHLLPREGGLEIHDLGCGTGSMPRWLAVQLAGPQHWVVYDRDRDLLVRAAEAPAPEASDGAAVTLETRARDVTLLEQAELSSADLITASALLDMMTDDEVGRLVTICAGARCPALITLSVVGRVDLHPADPMDLIIMDAFNDHQRRITGAGRLLGPEAVRAAVEGFARLGLDVLARPSPWRLGAESAALMDVWFSGWLGAACDQVPELREVADAYAGRRRAEMDTGSLSVTVHHEDLLAVPRGPARSD